VLDRARNVTDAATIIGRAPACASSSLTLFGHEDGDGVAISCEVSPHGTGYVLPEESGLLVHTNHFLADVRGGDDTGVGQTPDTVLRWHTVRRRLAGPCAAGRAGLPELRSALASHAGGSGALCCHPDPADQPLDRYETLATIAIDPSRGQLDVRRGGCCSDREP
jgi:isopenicillin-N N-acyltransferase-like protein